MLFNYSLTALTALSIYQSPFLTLSPFNLPIFTSIQSSNFHFFSTSLIYAQQNSCFIQLSHCTFTHFQDSIVLIDSSNNLSRKTETKTIRHPIDDDVDSQYEDDDEHMVDEKPNSNKKNDYALKTVTSTIQPETKTVIKPIITEKLYEDATFTNELNLTEQILQIRHCHFSKVDKSPHGAVFCNSQQSSLTIVSTIFDHCNSITTGGAITFKGNEIKFHKVCFSNCDSKDRGQAFFLKFSNESHNTCTSLAILSHINIIECPSQFHSGSDSVYIENAHSITIHTVNSSYNHATKRGSSFTFVLNNNKNITKSIMFNYGYISHNVGRSIFSIMKENGGGTNIEFHRIAFIENKLSVESQSGSILQLDSSVKVLLSEVTTWKNLQNPNFLFCRGGILHLQNCLVDVPQTQLENYFVDCKYAIFNCRTITSLKPNRNNIEEFDCVHNSKFMPKEKSWTRTEAQFKLVKTLLCIGAFCLLIIISFNFFYQI